ncbi:sensor histidine kinase [Haliscomenobacter hydrossis]|uniref:Signal transduction histidine kinase n=1 Tax=Haliscomenobacter hydrossis (strain ATCC 27775 / DSM 1100 / LMG 10767 / O) TaxID=760192 RepID=F4KRI3_HALH1|nr:histidine kinase [Haliscomenobacter hydrossis]AEE47973.1 putative signal transduction histidine kinase [Haliscomenobacter hydrossis DSM 1100]
MSIGINKERVKLYLYLAGISLLLSALIDFASDPETALKSSVNYTWLMLYVVVLHFILFEYTLPFIQFKWKRLLVAPILIFVHLMLYAFGTFAWRYIGIQLYVYSPLKEYASIIEGVRDHFGNTIGSVLFFGISRHIYDYRKLRKTAQQLRIEKQEAELNYLKSQTNPHFLFNTLNNIYSLARDKSDLAPESILRLSKILRFMLYEAGGAFIAIEQELKIITDYIALEQLRYDDSLHVNFNYDVEDMKQALPPLLLIPLVENAFKHGVSESRHQPFVDIHLSVNKRQLTFLVKNSAEVFPEEGRVKENIGLANLRRQLALLFADYQLLVQQDEHVFTATLKINLASHV